MRGQFHSYTTAGKLARLTVYFWQMELRTRRWQGSRDIGLEAAQRDENFGSAVQVYGLTANRQ